MRGEGRERRGRRERGGRERGKYGEIERERFSTITVCV